jgi:putative transposase
MTKHKLPARLDAHSTALVPAPVGDLATWQIEVATARGALIDECEHIAAASAVTIARAERLLCERVKERAMPQELLDLARLANARRGKKGRSLSTQRLSAWRKVVRGAATPGERLSRLAPGGRGKRWQLSQDVAAVLALYRKPNKPTLRWCVKEIVGADGGPAFNSLYERCRRELRKLPAPVFYPGRNSGAALKALLPFRRRDSLCHAPNDIWIGDGHGAKLRIAHPDTGNPFVPEVTVIMDVATRYVVGWSVSLSENCLAVADALRHAVSRHGIPLVYYSDNGGGQANKMFDAPVIGVLTSLGIAHKTGWPSNPQGRGLIERFWRTVLIALAKRFATYQGRGADRETLREVSREIDRTLRASKQGEISKLPERLPRFHEFLEALEIEISAYNEAHHHRSLPKLNGTVHATPAEYRAHRLAGTEPQVPPPQDVAALFMPSVRRVAARGELKLWNGIYYHRDLMLVDREEVAVGYDIHDASYVLVRRLSGEFICRAELAGNQSAFMPKPFIERLRDEREARQRRRLESKLEQVAAERNAATATFAPPLWTPDERRALEAEALLPAPPPPALPVELMEEMDRFALWKQLRERTAAGEALDDSMARFYRGYAETAELYLKTEEECGAAASELEIEVLRPAPAVNVLELTDVRKHEYWNTLDRRQASGEKLTDHEVEFWRHWQTESYFRIVREADEEFARLLATRARNASE